MTVEDGNHALLIGTIAGALRTGTTIYEDTVSVAPVRGSDGVTYENMLRVDLPSGIYMVTVERISGR
jgi:hypothetical protein